MLLEHYNYSIESCRDPVFALVEIDSVDRLLKINYAQVLQRDSFCSGMGLVVEIARIVEGVVVLKIMNFCAFVKTKPSQEYAFMVNL